MIDFEEEPFELFDHKQNVDKITDTLFLGSARGALDKKYLDELGVKHILICGTELRRFFPKSYNYFQIPLVDHDDFDIAQHFKSTIELIDSNTPIFVHCKRGVSRSASIVLAYLMWKNKMSFDEAFNYLKQKRSVVLPNAGFVRQLREFEKTLSENNWELQK